MANFFSNFGLGMEGSDDARRADQQYRQGEQSLQVGAQGLESGKQRQVLTDQAIQTGRMGLEDATRTRTNAANERAAVSGSGDDMDQTYGAVARARRSSGDLSGLESANESRRINATKAVLDLARDAQIGTDPKTAEQKFRSYGFGKDAVPGSMEFGSVPSDKDPKWADVQAQHPDWQPGDHLISVIHKDSGQRIVQNATAIIRANSKQDVHTVAPGGSAFVTGAGSAPRMITAPEKTQPFAPSANIEKVQVKDAEGGERTYLWDITKREWVGGTPPAGTQTPEPSVHKRLPELREATSELLKIPGMATKTNPNDPADTHMTLTPQGQAIAPRVEALIMANKSLPPHTAILVAQHGQPARDAEGNAVVTFGGKTYPLTSGQKAKSDAAPASGKQNDRVKILREELKDPNNTEEDNRNLNAEIAALERKGGNQDSTPKPAVEKPKPAAASKPASEKQKDAEPEWPKQKGEVTSIDDSPAKADYKRSQSRAAEKLQAERDAKSVGLAKEAQTLRDKLAKGEVDRADYSALKKAAINPNFTAKEKARIAVILAGLQPGSSGDRGNVSSAGLGQ